MQLRYMGFDQTEAVRVYRFDSIVERAPTVRYRVTVDLTLFLKHHVGIQEGPSLCARKLAADLETVQQREHTLTNEDLLAYVTARAEAQARKAAARKPGVRRRGPVRHDTWGQPAGASASGARSGFPGHNGK
ncbi:MAG: hypothetical protein ABSH44_06500 [Bryobacteraceae bacterium]